VISSVFKLFKAIFIFIKSATKAI